MEEVGARAMLAPMLGDAAALVSHFNAELSNEVLDDILESIHRDDDNTGPNDFIPTILAKSLGRNCAVESRFYSKVRKVGDGKKRNFQLCMNAHTFGMRAGRNESNSSIHSEIFPSTRNGLRQAILIAQRKANIMKIKGACDQCLEKNFPRVRVAVGKTKKCATCVLEDVLG